MRLKLWKMKPTSRLRMRARAAWPSGGDRLAVQRVAAVRGRVEQAENREQRGLAAAGRAGDRDVLALPNLEMDARERVGLDFVGVEHLGDGFQFDERTVCIHRLLSLCCQLRRLFN